MTKFLQRLRINRGAKLMGKVEKLYDEGNIVEADRLKNKITKDPNKLYWIRQRLYELKVRG